MIIDTHQHFWKLDRGDYGWLTADLAPLYRDFLPKDLEPLLKNAGVDGTIVVQAADSEAETEFLLGLADQHDWILGVVGWVDLAADQAAQSIARLSAHPKLVGLRPMLQDLPDDQWILNEGLTPAISAMIHHSLTFDALVMPRHLPYLKQFLKTWPELRVVVDHCAKPAIRSGAFQPWAADLAEVAAFPQVMCKMSGLATEAGDNWTAKDLAPYMDHVLTVFGPERVLFGSDWPVLTLAGSYSDWWATLWTNCLEQATKTDRQRILETNPRTAYPRLPGSA